jgi:transcriptional regulator with XRE-family HTH domain
MPELEVVNTVDYSNGPAELGLQLVREVIHCTTCGLVQYRTSQGHCRRCQRLVPRKLEFPIPFGKKQEQRRDNRPLFKKRPNLETVKNIGQRILQLRESRGLTHGQLCALSRVSRSYISRIESGQMTPSLATLERISEALGISLNRCFVPMSDSEALLEDPFIRGVRHFLRQLDWEQWQSILKRLVAISGHVSGGPVRLRRLGRPRSDRANSATQRPAAMGHR